MYRFYDEKDKIREIQKYLFVTENGNYDERTSEAVRKVQSENNMEQTGKIDYDTFILIYLEYIEEKQRQMLKARFNDVDFPLKLNSYSEAVSVTNEMLIRLSRFYGIQTNLRYSDYYGRRTESVLEALADIYGIERKYGEIDRDMYEMLEKDFHTIKVRGD